ncbi:MAG TPA: hypothetical protein VL475_12970 [Planctomycetaceae bacterium]|nr:hypothetical protein [Planctomycetaceae bacterium]
MLHQQKLSVRRPDAAGSEERQEEQKQDLRAAIAGEKFQPGHEPLHQGKAPGLSIPQC